MIVFPNCKINLGLNILARREDGFHELKTLFYPLSLTDVLEIIPSPDQLTTFSSSGISIPNDGTKNLCQKAYDIMHQKHSVSPVNIHLHKVIPIGSGLGGGSADAAFTLQVLDEMFSKNLSKEALLQMASILGSDCSFFLENKPCIATGRGEILEPFPVSLKGYHLILAMLPIHVSTKDAFAGIKPKVPCHDLTEVVSRPVDQWKDRLINDFEEGIFNLYPEIGKIKEEFYKMGAVYASMSGSGASVFGIFEESPNIDLTSQFPKCFIWRENLQI